MKNNFEYITSRQNEKVKDFARLSMSKYREEKHLFLAEGVKLAAEACSAGAVSALLVADSARERDEIKSLLDKCGDDVIQYILADHVFEKVTTESAPQGVIAVVRYPEGYGTESCDLDGRRVVALDGIRDPGNLGTIIRSAAALGYDDVILGDSADPFGTKAVRASMGALFKVRLVKCGNLAEYLKKLSASRRVIGAALRDDSEDFTSIELLDSDIPVIGNEGHGISKDVASSCSMFVKIPMSEGSESLNASVAASVIMWEYSKNRQSII